MKPVTVRKIGNSLGVTMTELLNDMGVKEGDLLYPVRTPNGIEFTPYDPDFAAVMDTAQDIMGRYRNTLRALSK